MNLSEIENYCLAKPGAYLDWPFGPECAVVKVKAPSQDKGRIFAQLFMLRGKPVVTLNCDMMMGELYRSMYPGTVVRGYHCPPVQQPYFNTITLDGAVTGEELIEMIDHSYAAATSKLPKKYQRELFNQ
ncbi:MAG: MmcQ/YjbR family DNA-binding protein [Defluviitaleaceae bacterium]|nr:MmcQ/YjbR family DNA-binding protein [Defluviitaleaceae bacterium]